MTRDTCASSYETPAESTSSSTCDRDALCASSNYETGNDTKIGEMLTLKNFGIAEADSDFVAETVEKLVKEADAALEACQMLFGKVEGTTKLRKRIASEVKFLRGLNKESSCDLSQVRHTDSFVA